MSHDILIHSKYTNFPQNIWNEYQIKGVERGETMRVNARTRTGYISIYE